MARAAEDVPRQIANANTLFNVINTLLFIGFTGAFAKLAERLVPEREAREGVIIEPEFLEEAALKAPPVALQQVRLELGHIGGITIGMLEDIRSAFRAGDAAAFDDIARRDDAVDILEHEILHYLGKVRKGLLTEQESEELQNLMIATDNLENLADVIETDLVTLAHRASSLNTASGTETRTMLRELYETTLKSVQLAVQATRDNDQQVAESVLLLDPTIRQQSESLLSRKATRLPADDTDYLELVRLEMSLIDQLRRIYSLAKRIARVTLPPAIAHKA